MQYDITSGDVLVVGYPDDYGYDSITFSGFTAQDPESSIFLKFDNRASGAPYLVELDDMTCQIGSPITDKAGTYYGQLVEIKNGSIVRSGPLFRVNIREGIKLGQDTVVQNTGEVWGNPESYAAQAARSASEASASAAAASGYAGAASRSAGDAASSASAASDSAGAAAGSASAASGSAGAAANSASNAAGSAQDAAQSAQDARDALDDLAEQVKSILGLGGYGIYGVSGVGLANTTYTRLYNAVGLTAQVGTDGDNSAVVNDFDSISPWMRRKCVGTWSTDEQTGRARFIVNAFWGDPDYAEDGSMGDYVAVDCPPAYYYEDAENHILAISGYPHKGFRPFEFLRDPETGLCRDHTYRPAYPLGTNDAGETVCLAGTRPSCGHYKGLLDIARSYSPAAILKPTSAEWYEYCLATVEFATGEPQSVMRGCVDFRYAADAAVAIDADHVVVSAAFRNASVAGCNVYIGASYSSAYRGSHMVTAIDACTEDGTLDPAGDHGLLTLQEYAGTTSLEVGREYQICHRPWTSGLTNAVSTPSGSIVSNTAGKFPFKYRHAENLWGNITHTLMDVFNKRVEDGESYKLEWFLLKDYTYIPSSASKPDATDLSNTDLFDKLDYETPSAGYANGYITALTYDADKPDVRIPVVGSGGSAAKYYCDYASLVSSNVVRAVRGGGLWSNGSYAGPWSRSALHAPASASAPFGGDLFMSQ